MVHNTIDFFNVELILHSWDKTKLLMRNYSLYTLLDSGFYYFIEDFYIYTHE